MKKVLNLLLLLSFFLTVLAPLTGIHFHKLFSLLFLLLSAIHGVIYRNKMGWCRLLLFGLILLCFASGITGIIFTEILILMAIHKVTAFFLIFFLGIHIFLFRNRMK